MDVVLGGVTKPADVAGGFNLAGPKARKRMGGSCTRFQVDFAKEKMKKLPNLRSVLLTSDCDAWKRHFRAPHTDLISFPGGTSDEPSNVIPTKHTAWTKVSNILVHCTPW